MRTVMAFGFGALLRQSRRGVRGIEWADQPARVDEERKGPGASAIRRVLTGIPDRPRLEASEIAQGQPAL